MKLWNWIKGLFKRKPKVIETAPPPTPGSPTIAIINRSDLISDARARELAAAIQIQVSRDFKPAWGLDALIVFVGKNEQPKVGQWQVFLYDGDIGNGILGYHDFPSGTPQAWVSVSADVQNGMQVSGTLSHEVLEMLADPDIAKTAFGPNGWRYAFEVCDAPEDEAYGYTINGVLVSDFVLPAYFNPAGAAPYDFRGHVDHPFEVLSGGYMSYNDGAGWKQIRGQRLVADRMSRREFRPARGSRAARRR